MKNYWPRPAHIIHTADYRHFKTKKNPTGDHPMKKTNNYQLVSIFQRKAFHNFHEK
jgi:hypothetical protein